MDYGQRGVTSNVLEMYHLDHWNLRLLVHIGGLPLVSGTFVHCAMTTDILCLVEKDLVHLCCAGVMTAITR